METLNFLAAIAGIVLLCVAGTALTLSKMPDSAFRFRKK